jgi:hypothetical protein
MAASLLAAAEHAEAYGRVTVDLAETLQRADDKARAELQAAIDAAQQP